MQRTSGQSLVEVLVAIGVFLVVIGSAIALISGGEDLLADAANDVASLEYAIEGGEATRAIRDANWGALADGVYGLELSGDQWQFSGTSDQRDIFTRTVTVQSIDADTKIATTTVTWQTDPLRPQRVELAELLTNWVASANVSQCNLSGNWADPEIFASVDIGAGRQGMDIIATGTLVYIVSTASDSAKKDLSIFDVSTSSSPQLLGELNTGGGINEIALYGRYLYAVSSDDSKEFIVIDVGDPEAPVEITNLDLPGTGNAISITYDNNHVYIGRAYSSTKQELEIIDVQTPSNPLIAAELDMNTSILKVYAWGDRLYYAYYNATADIGVRDISNPPAAPFITSWDVGVDDVYSMYVDGETSKFMVGTDWNGTYIYLDASNELTPIIKDSVAIAGRIWDLVSSNGIGIAGNSNSNAEFQSLDISDPINIRVIGSKNLSQLVTGISCIGNIVYASVRSNDALQVISAGD